MCHSCSQPSRLPSMLSTVFTRPNRSNSVEVPQTSKNILAHGGGSCIVGEV
jgi:hypothetical protein